MSALGGVNDHFKHKLCYFTPLIGVYILVLVRFLQWSFLCYYHWFC